MARLKSDIEEGLMQYSIVSFIKDEETGLDIEITRDKNVGDFTISARLTAGCQWASCEYCTGEDSLLMWVDWFKDDAERFCEMKWRSINYEELQWFDKEQDAFDNPLVIEGVRA